MISFLAFAAIASADTVSVTNEVHLHASSGGNSVSSGSSIHTGSVSTSVDIENDEPTEDVHIYVSTTTESSVHIDIKNGSGKSGADGKDGEDGSNGSAGLNGRSGSDGRDGTASVQIEPHPKSITPHVHVVAISGAATTTASVTEPAVATLAVKETFADSFTHSVHLFWQGLTSYVWNFFTK